MKDKGCYLKFKEYDESIIIAKHNGDITMAEFYDMCRQISIAKFGEHNTKKYFDS